MRTTLLAGCLVLLTSCGTAAPTTTAAPSTPTTAPVSSDSVTAPTKGPTPVKPEGDTINPRKVPWTTAKPVDRGRKVKLTWWSGVAPCTVLDRVKVSETRSKVTITLYEGARSKDVACIAIAIEKTTTVKLKAPLGKRKLVDGGKKR
ncbi:hypothetical protein OIE66_38470 [Nonomuraea sp. NBC_01738]|uniref:hypothetical protein n=1 Tax=Nonomuraea sp. NBC_01738 TaxID=2976003 RepID=UPI002E12B7FF|nr:hypothetical protein OIE66_38470 [Nonomuraea sp. NBC_01738]